MGRKNISAKEQLLQVGAQTITYTLTYANRKSVGITIRPDMSVEVRAPYTTTPATVAEIMQQRAPWIMRHLQKFAQRPVQPRPSIKPKGESYQFLGCALPLKVAPLADGTSRERVSLDNAGLRVWVKDVKDKARIEALLEKWKRGQAEDVFARQLLLMLAHFNGNAPKWPDLAIRSMKARWGSCSAHGKITLNLKLIHLDLALIDYVIMHELCHLFEHNHSKNYYALLSRMMPDWEARRQQLNEIGMPE